MNAKLAAAWWNGLPHPVQAGIVAFGMGVLGFGEPILQNWVQGGAVCSAAFSVCAKGYLISALKAGIAGVMGLYIKSSLYHQPKGSGS